MMLAIVLHDQFAPNWYNGLCNVTTDYEISIGIANNGFCVRVLLNECFVFLRVTICDYGQHISVSHMAPNHHNHMPHRMISYHCHAIAYCIMYRVVPDHGMPCHAMSYDQITQYNILNYLSWNSIVLFHPLTPSQQISYKIVVQMA